MDSFLIAFNAVFPFLLYISFGYITRAIGVVDETHPIWTAAARSPESWWY